jgi:hypothetical protein
MLGAAIVLAKDANAQVRMRSGVVEMIDHLKALGRIGP